MSIDPPDEELAGQVRKSLGWSFFSSIASRLGTFVTGIILAHLLAPSDYGEFTVALVAMTVLVNLNDLGIEQTLVRWPGKVDDVGPTAVTVMFGFSLVLFAIWYVGAGPFASVMGAPSAAPLVQVLALGVVINGAFACPSAMLTRSFRQDLRTAADLTGFFVGTGLTVAFALMGLGAWSLVWGRFAGNAVVSGMHFMLTPVRYRPGWDPVAARQLLSSGLPIAGATIVAVAVLNVDYVIVGHNLGSTALGLYTLAFNLASWPVTFFAVSVARVSVAAFGRLQHDRSGLQEGYDKAFRLLCAATLPVCLLIGVFAHPLVEFVYGQKWSASAAILPFLAALGFFRVVFQLWADLLVAVGAGRRVLITQAVWLVALIVGISLATRHGLTAVGVAHLVVAGCVVLPVYLAVLRGVARPFGAPVRTARIMLAGVPAGVVGGLALLLPGPPVVQLIVGGPACLIVYVLLLLPLRSSVGVDPFAKRREQRYVGRHRPYVPTYPMGELIHQHAAATPRVVVEAAATAPIPRRS